MFALSLEPEDAAVKMLVSNANKYRKDNLNLCPSAVVKMRD
jgi:hypothetical protein